jgi:hypothetical protein
VPRTIHVTGQLDAHNIGFAERARITIEHRRLQHRKLAA